MNTVLQLTQVFNDNFMAYFRSHVAHANVTGRNFYSDHELLGDIYADLQGQIDTIAELLRSLQADMPCDIADVVAGSTVNTDCIMGTSDELLSEVRTDLQDLKDCYAELITVADVEGSLEISNYAQERVLVLAKYIWMLDSTLS